MARTDVHSPSNIVPEDYRLVTFGTWREGEEFMHEKAACTQVVARYVEQHGARFSDHEHGGSCMVCGAHMLDFAIFHHAPTNTLIRTGCECADQIDAGVKPRLAKYQEGLRERKRRGQKEEEARTWLQANGFDAAWTLYQGWKTSGEETNYADQGWMATGWDDLVPYWQGRIQDVCYTIRDIVHNLVKYGSLSDAQQRYLGTLCSRHEDFVTKAQTDANERSDAPDAPEGRVEIVGTVLSVKIREGYYGVELKMTVQHESGWRVWSTIPAAIADQVEDLDDLKGQQVAFTATLKRSDDDASFAFASRPSKASLITEAA
jgi:hypothetical protein